MDRTIVEFERNGQAMSERIISAVAEAKGVSSADLDEPLFFVVDPDALDRLFRSSTGNSEQVSPLIHFTYSGLSICATPSRIRVTEGEEESCSGGGKVD